MTPLAVLAALVSLFVVANAQYVAPGPPGVTLTSKPSPSQFLIQPPFVRPYTGDDIPVTFGMQMNGTNLPEQVLVSPASPDGSFYTVKWQTPQALLVPGTVYYSIFFPVPTKSSFSVTVTPHNYTVYAGYPGKYHSGAIYFAQIGPLAYNTVYYYEIVSKAAPSMNRTYQFKTMPAGGSPCRLASLTSNSSSTYDNVNLGHPDVILFAADLCYADNFGPPCAPFNGTDVPSGPSRTCGEGGLRWDSWGRLSEKTLSFYPTTFVAGNHEEEGVAAWNASATSSLRTETAFPATSCPPALASPKAPFFYSFNVGYVHVIALSSYEPFTKYTQQYNWLNSDLAAINRAITPFVVVFFHSPWYNTDVSHYLEGESLRQDYEGFLYNAKVDLVIAGHVHAYERSKPVYQVAVNPCGPVYVTVGDGGNDEGVAGPFYNAMDNSPREYTQTRDYYFGHAELDVKNATYTEFSWYLYIQYHSTLHPTYGCSMMHVSLEYVYTILRSICTCCL
eukprot:SM000115S23898  [mRNA]  locus=s115:73582:76630:- [translate_table: standard]